MAISKYKYYIISINSESQIPQIIILIEVLAVKPILQPLF